MEAEAEAELVVELELEMAARGSSSRRGTYRVGKVGPGTRCLRSIPMAPVHQENMAHRTRACFPWGKPLGWSDPTAALRPPCPVRCGPGVPPLVSLPCG